MTGGEQTRFPIARALSEVLPYIQRYSGKTIVVKYGGHAMGSERAMHDFARDIVLIGQLGLKPVVVHGGGPQIGAMLARLGVETSFKNGLRVTNEATMEVVEMVLAGSINTSIVAAVNAAGGKAVGLSGVDANLIRARKATGGYTDQDSNLARVIDMGCVGRPDQIDSSVLTTLVMAGFVPIVAPIGVGADGTRYNINADEAAGAIAATLGAARLILMTDVEGVQDADGLLIRRLGAARARALIAEGVASGGMVPKLMTAILAIEKGVRASVIINGTIPHAVLNELFTEDGAGTLLHCEDKT